MSCSWASSVRIISTRSAELKPSSINFGISSPRLRFHASMTTSMLLLIKKRARSATQALCSSESCEYEMKTLDVVIPTKIPGVVCGSFGQLRGRKEQFVAAQILLKGVAARERFAQLRSRQRIIEGCGPALHTAQGTYERFGNAVVAQRLQWQQIVFPVDRGNNDSAQSARAQHAIHGEPRRAAVAVAERVHFGYHKHGHDGLGERMGQGAYPFESFPQAPDDKFRYDEVSAAGLIGFFFPFSGFSVRPLLHDERVDVLQPHKKFIGILRRTVPPGGGRRCLERAQDVMRVFITVLDDLSLEDDGFCLLDLERRSLDVVGEVRLKEREILARDARGRGILDAFQFGLIERSEQRVEDFQPMRIVGTACSSR